MIPKKTTKRVVEVTKKLLTDFNPTKYFNEHQNITLQYLIDTLNPTEQDSEGNTEKKLISRYIAEEYFNKYNKKNEPEERKNLAIITYQYFIYKNFDEYYSFLYEE